MLPSGWRAVVISSTVLSKTFDNGKIAGKKIGSLPIKHFNLCPGPSFVTRKNTNKAEALKKAASLSNQNSLSFEKDGAWLKCLDHLPPGLVAAT